MILSDSVLMVTGSILMLTMVDSNGSAGGIPAQTYSVVGTPNDLKIEFIRVTDLLLDHRRQ